MKAAAAVLGASLLFFLGVLTGVGRREAVPPPTAIPLGVGERSGGRRTHRSPAPRRCAEHGRRRPATPPAPVDTVDAQDGPTGTTAVDRSPTATDRHDGFDDAVEHHHDPVRSRWSRSTARSTAGPEGKGKGKREPCPSTTTATGEAPGGGGNR